MRHPHVVDALARDLIAAGRDPDFAVAAAHVLVALALDDVPEDENDDEDTDDAAEG